MNQYITGSIIKKLREEKNLTQSQLAELLMVSDKTVSKWETGKGYPDITLLEPISKILCISVSELLAGEKTINNNVSANMLKPNFYVCPICGNVFYSIGKGNVTCHGINLPTLEAEKSNDIVILNQEDELYVSVKHEMTKIHYVSFIASVGFDCVNIVKLYPEGNAEAYFKKNKTKTIFYYCNKDGLFFKKV